MSPVDPAPQEIPAEDTSEPREPVPDTTPASKRRASGFDGDGHLKSSRSGALYSGLIIAAIISILVLIFIIQNSESTAIRFLGFEWSLPLGVGVLLAVIAGMLIIAIPGSIRIFQLRRSLTKNEKRTRSGS